MGAHRVRRLCFAYMMPMDLHTVSGRCRGDPDGREDTLYLNPGMESSCESGALCELFAAHGFGLLDYGGSIYIGRRT